MLNPIVFKVLIKRFLLLLVPLILIYKDVKFLLLLYLYKFWAIEKIEVFVIFFTPRIFLVPAVVHIKVFPFKFVSVHKILLRVKKIDSNKEFLSDNLIIIYEFITY